MKSRREYYIKEVIGCVLWVVLLTGYFQCGGIEGIRAKWDGMARPALAGWKERVGDLAGKMRL